MGKTTPLTYMAIVKTTDRMVVIESIINNALKDRQKYCNCCDKDYDGTLCCEDPQIGDNVDHVRALIIDNQIIRSRNKYETGKGSEKGAMRLAFRLPPRIYHILSTYFKNYGEKFPKDTPELYRLMRKFNKLCAVDKI